MVTEPTMEGAGGQCDTVTQECHVSGRGVNDVHTKEDRRKGAEI